MANDYSFSGAGGSFLDINANVTGPMVFAPATGTTVLVTQSRTPRIYFNSGATIAALTIRLPPQPDAFETIEFGFAYAVTALTVTDAASAAVMNAPTAAAAGTSFEFHWVPPSTTAAGYWARWR